MIVRRRFLTVGKHAEAGMRAERPPLDVEDVALVLGNPDHDNGKEARKRLGRRTVFVYYTETEDEVYVRSVSATSRRLAP